MSNFTQNNQSGDNYMNFGKSPREISPGLERQFLSEIPKTSKVSISSTLGDDESFQFAILIKKYLAEQGYEVGEVCRAVRSDPIIGLAMNNSDSKNIKIMVGGNT